MPFAKGSTHFRKNMRVLSIVLTLSASFIVPAFAAEDQGGCVSNFSVSGSFFTGKQYKTSVVLPEVSSQTAFKKAYASIVKKGYQITQSDKDIGVISASQQVTGSKGGKTAPLNVLVESDSGAGSKIDFSFSTAGGLMAPEDAVRDEFCKITSEILSK